MDLCLCKQVWQFICYVALICLMLVTSCKVKQWIACEQALCLGKKWKNREGRERGRACRQIFEVAVGPSSLAISDHLSAISLSVTWIHWNVINFVCKRGSVGNARLLPRAKMLLVPMRFFFLWRVHVDYMLCRVKSIVKLCTLFTTLHPENHTCIGQIRECPPLPPAGHV